MSVIKNSTTKKTAAAATDLPMLTPEEFIEQLRAMQARIPEFVQLPKMRDMRTIHRIAKLSNEYAHEGIGAVGASEVVQTAIGQTPEQLHQSEDEIARWAVAESEVRTVLRGMIAANLVRRHRLGLAVMQAYHVSRQLVRQEEHAHLLPHVERMAQLRKLNRRRNKPATEPQTQTQTQDKPIA
jgi:hypothetical protein